MINRSYNNNYVRLFEGARCGWAEKMKEEKIEWTSEEKAEIERKKKHLKEALPLFWAALIPTYFTSQTCDRLLSIIFGVGISYINVPPYFPILIHFSSPFTVLGFMAVYYLWTLGEKRDAVLWYFCIVIFQSVIMIFGETWAHPEGFVYGPWVWFAIEIPLVQLCLFGPSLVIAVAKRTKQRALAVVVTAAVIVLCIAIFSIVHWVFWLPNFPDFTWKGIQGPVKPGNLLLYYMAILGPISIGIAAAMQLSERVRTGIAIREMKERRAEERKRKKKEKRQ